MVGQQSAPVAKISLFRSLFRGREGHAWLFFDEAVPAALARKPGSHILTETMEDRPDLGFDSYDRFFPSQDTLPHGGFGNLIALPLQKRLQTRTFKACEELGSRDDGDPIEAPNRQ